ncbi:MAG: hypothetical protein GY940_13940 [bacterium]|nr:hypothetical protein [bacterium]
MANRADVFVINKLKQGDIGFQRKPTDETIDMADKINTGNEKRVPLLDPNVSLIIKAPQGVDITNCPLKVESDVDLSVLYSVTHSYWKIKIEPNTLPPDVPTSVNVTVGEDDLEEEPPPEEPPGGGS